jgi:molecular chaperone HscB
MNATVAAAGNPSVSEAASAPALNLQDDDFRLLGLPRRFDLDADELDRRWKALQRQVHPDRFTAQGAAAQRVAMQWSVRVNEAYQRLRQPLKRAAYLCELMGAAIDAERNTAMPAAFMMQQLEWREALEDAAMAPELKALLDQTRAARHEALGHIERLLDAEIDATAAAQQVRALMFIERFEAEVAQKLERAE